MKKIICFMILSIFIISLISAESIGTFPQDADVEIYNTCNNCTYCNYTRIKGVNNQTLLSNVQATQDGTYFYYNLGEGNTTTLGDYTYCYDCGNAAESETGCNTFKITPSGKSGTENLVTIIFLVLMIYGITFIGFFYGRNIPITILGGMAMMFLGIYLINSGVIIYRDNLTNYFSYLTIALGAIMAFWAALEQLDIL
ncbi:hypothetical protein BMS3Abin17_00075 [archaeon BMS3Abin17]|nr:hypothetical protein BMS3Abin17_00075 [archaeon BMS3Abin17]HDZ60176.1 hypothetical protein [Candidatus Pacearchaeota archaeon]